MLIEYHLKQDINCQVVYLTDSLDLAEQASIEFNEILTDSSRLTVYACTGENDQDIPEGTVYICDEADSLVTNLKFTTTRVYKNAKLNFAGLLGMHASATKCYFMSATYSKFAEYMLQEVFDVKEIFAPKTMFQLSSENLNDDNYNIVDRPAKDVVHMHEMLKKDMSEVMKR